MLLLTSIGVGIIVGLIALKFLRDRYSTQFSPVAIIAASLVGYLLSARLGGDGILAVATMGLIFGNVYVKGKDQLEEFSMMFSKAIEIIIFVMVGIIIRVPLTFDFLLRSLFLFAVLFLIRLVAVSTVLKKQGYSSREIAFISLNMPKGITIATVVLVLSTYRYVDITITLQLMVTIMLYSLITSSIADAKARKILGHELVSSKDKPVSAEQVYTSEFSMTPEKTGAAIKPEGEKKGIKRNKASNRRKKAARSHSKKVQKKRKSTRKNIGKKSKKKLKKR
jgi:NhaP-type Na+/H+ or K+/H+ antiporter